MLQTWTLMNCANFAMLLTSPQRVCFPQTKLTLGCSTYQGTWTKSCKMQTGVFFAARSMISLKDGVGESSGVGLVLPIWQKLPFSLGHPTCGASSRMTMAKPSEFSSDCTYHSACESLSLMLDGLVRCCSFKDALQNLLTNQKPTMTNSSPQLVGTKTSISVATGHYWRTFDCF